jgi:CubicO group peptidase (beta-lactamase class C family)
MIVRLANTGRLSLDDRVGDLLPWYRQDTGQRLTVRHLLAHTSGLPDDPALAGAALAPGAVTRSVVLACCSHDLQWEPGTRMRHGDTGYVLLGAIVEQVTGKPYPQAMRELVLTPVSAPDDSSDDAT